MADWMSAALDKVCPEINGLIDDFNAGVNTRIKKEALLEDIMKNAKWGKPRVCDAKG